MTTTNANTISVVWIVSLRVGHDTRPASAHDSCANAKNSLPGCDSHATPRAGEQSADDHQDAQHERGVGEVVIAARRRATTQPTANAIFSLVDHLDAVAANSRSSMCFRALPTAVATILCRPVAGRPGGNRTPNLRFWRPPLCQLSYWPNQRSK